MRKCQEQLIESFKNTKVGNHRVEIRENGRKFFLYNTCICQTKVIDGVKYFKTDVSYGTVTTTRSVNGYRAHFLNSGYKEVDEF